MIAFHDPELSNHLNEIGFIPDVSYQMCSVIPLRQQPDNNFVYYDYYYLSLVGIQDSSFWFHTNS